MKCFPILTSQSRLNIKHFSIGIVRDAMLSTMNDMILAYDKHIGEEKLSCVMLNTHPLYFLLASEIRKLSSTFIT